MTTSELLHPLRRTPAVTDRSARTRPAALTSRPAHLDPRWVRPALGALLLLTALAYIWNLSDSGYANSFYAAAVQAGTKSWKAFFFGSIDASNFITVDKPPASLWVMVISGRIFGFSSWSMLVPQALEGVAAVALLYAAVKRWFGPGAGLGAGAVFAATPVAALMFRFNNPDALLVLTLVAAAYCLTRAIENASTRWLVTGGAMIGVAFLAKMMQGFIVLPGFALVYLVAAPTPLRRRITQLVAGGASVLVTAGWWVAVVALWPAGSRPFIDGSPDNSILNLIMGYNGLGRIFGGSGGGGGGGGTGFAGSPGPLRLFNSLMGAQASWLLPAALLGLAFGLWERRRAPRTDRVRAALLLWGSWLVVTAVVFSFGQGVIHTYYTVALAPAIGALLAIVGSRLWRRRESVPVRVFAAATVATSGAWAFILLARTPSWEPWLRPLVAVSAVAAVVGLLAAPALGRLAHRATIVAAVLGVVACLAGPVAFAAETVTTPQGGSLASAGPASTSGAGGVGGGMPGPGRPGGAGAPTGGPPTLPSGARARFRGLRPNRAGGGTPGGAGVQLNAALRSALTANASRYRWVAATSGSQSAATIELATARPVMAIGGFNNQGGNLTLAQFERYVARGDVHFYLASGAGGPGGGPGGGASSSAITAWVKAHFKAQTIGGQTVYDLTRSA